MDAALPDSLYMPTTSSPTFSMCWVNWVKNLGTCVPSRSQSVASSQPNTGSVGGGGGGEGGREGGREGEREGGRERGRGEREGGREEGGREGGGR